VSDDTYADDTVHSDFDDFLHDFYDDLLSERLREDGTHILSHTDTENLQPPDLISIVENSFGQTKYLEKLEPKTQDVHPYEILQLNARGFPKSLSMFWSFGLQYSVELAAAIIHKAVTLIPAFESKTNSSWTTYFNPDPSTVQGFSILPFVSFSVLPEPLSNARNSWTFLGEFIRDVGDHQLYKWGNFFGGSISTYLKIVNGSLDVISLFANSFADLFGISFLLPSVAAFGPALDSVKSVTSGGDHDPHLHFAHGGEADFRGVNGTHYVLLSSPGLSFSARTLDATFFMHDLFVNGSFFSEVAWTVVTSNDTFYVLFHAKRSWCMYRCPTLTEAESQKRPDVLVTSKSGLRFGRGQDSIWKSPAGDLTVEMKRHTLKVSTHGWMTTATRRPVYGWRSGPTWRIDFEVQPLPEADGHGLLDYPRKSCFPHGLIGQSFDGDQLRADGKKDDYRKNGTVTTEAMAEGAIEGTAHEYAVAGPFETQFLYSRFDKTKCGPRSLLGLNLTSSGGTTDERVGASDPMQESMMKHVA
jgi:hypothetical protein